MKKHLLLIFLLITQVALAQIPKPMPDTYVNDYAGVLSKEQVTALNRDIFKIEKQAGVQVAIILIDKIPEAYDIQDFAVLVGKKWHVGTNKKGLVYVAAIGQHKQRIEVARNLDDIFPGAKCLAILDAMKPSFRDKDYNAGLGILVSQISAALQVQAQQTASTPDQSQSSQTANQAAQAPKAAEPQEDTKRSIIGFLGIVVMVLLVIMYVRSRKRKQKAMQDFYNNNNNSNPGYYNPNQPNPNQPNGGPGYGNPGYGMQQPPDHTFRNVAAGVIGGAVAGYAARSIQDNLSNNHNVNNQHPADQNRHANLSNNDDNVNTNQPSNWGNWGGSGNSDDNSSYDSGFSDDSSSDSSSSDSDSSSSGATSDW